MEQENMINQIVDFVQQHHESTASRAVYRRILGSYPGSVDNTVLSELKSGLEASHPDEVETLYYMIK